MAETVGGGDMATRFEEDDCEGQTGSMAEAPLAANLAEEAAPRARLPWIGALENPHLGPMVVLNESGYLVPLLTAAELLRGCKYFWHRSQ